MKLDEGLKAMKDHYAEAEISRRIREAKRELGVIHLPTVETKPPPRRRRGLLALSRSKSR